MLRSCAAPWDCDFGDDQARTDGEKRWMDLLVSLERCSIDMINATLWWFKLSVVGKKKTSSLFRSRDYMATRKKTGICPCLWYCGNVITTTMRQVLSRDSCDDINTGEESRGKPRLNAIG